MDTAARARASWDSVRSTLEVTTQLGLPSLGVNRHFHVQQDGRFIVEGDCVLATGILLDSWNLDARPVRVPCEQKVVVRMKLSDWHAVGKHSPCLRILHSMLGEDEALPVIDTTFGAAVVSGLCTIRSDESLTMAEVFSGAYNGWSQAAYVLRSLGVPVHVRWLLDVEPQCFAASQLIHGGNLVKVSNNRELRHALEGSCDVFAVANVTHDWWHGLLALPNLSLLVMSPPCPPWSTASSGPGLQCAEGRLFLNMLSIIEVVKVPCVCVEQVAGFCKHVDAKEIERVWDDVGYRKVWSRVVDLADTSPGSRPRYLAVYLRKDVEQQPVQAALPVVPVRPKLGPAQCIASLPDDLLQPCLLSEEVLQLYLDPQLLPVRRGRTDPLRYRTRGSRDTFGCVMAQYHFQHELPWSVLCRNGIMGLLLESPQGLRFMSRLETTFLHVLQRPFLLDADNRTQMRQVGNSLATTQAMHALVNALNLSGLCVPPVDLTRAIQRCLEDRTHAGNFLLFRNSKGWVVCRKEQVAELHVSWPVRAPFGQSLQEQEVRFGRIWLEDGDRAFMLAVPEDVSLHLALRVVGVDACLEEIDRAACLLRSSCAVEPAEAPVCRTKLPVASVPALVMPHGLVLHDDDGVIGVLAGLTLYLLRGDSPSLAWACQSVIEQEIARQGRPEATSCWLTFHGLPLHDFRSLRGLVTLHLLSDWEPAPTPHIHPEDLAAVHLEAASGPVMFCAPVEKAHHVAATFPDQVFHAAGWRVVHTASADHALTLFAPEPMRGLQLPERGLLTLCGYQMFTGVLQYLHRRGHAGVDRVLVLVQVSGKCCWRGTLPGHLRFDELLDVWHQCHVRVGVPCRSRIMSGPNHVDGTWTLAEGRSGSRVQVSHAKTGHLRVTLMPEVHGGGAKDKKWATTQNEVAQVLLHKGLSLADASHAVDRLLPVAGLSRVQRVMQLTNDDHKWQQLASLCEQFGVMLPPVTDRTAKATKAVSQEAKRRAQNMPPVTAKDFVLQDSFFHNEDGTQAQLVKDPFPGCTGVCLVDAPDAVSLIQAYQHSSPDELAFVVVGAECPHAQSCSGKITCPAYNLRHEPVLLQCCLHQVGDKKLTMRCRHAAEVIVPEATCIAVTIFKDEYKGVDEWAAMCANPVRLVTEVLRDAGNPRPVESPWGRSYRNDSGQTTPGECTSIQFHARTATDSLETLLKRSGHNRVYLTPKTWSHDISPHYAVVWCASDKDAAAQAALQLPNQLGLARSRGRFGIRVLTAGFQQAHAVLKPGTPLPAQVSVRVMFKASNMPPGARAQDVAEWIKKISWDAKPLRQLGPRQWLIGASEGPPSGNHSFNHCPVLLQPASQKGPRPALVQAGRPARPVDSQVPSTDTAPHDPWAEYLQSRGKEPAPGGPLPAPTTEGSSSRRFGEQDARIAKLEHSIQTLQADQAAVRSEVSDSRSALQAQLQEVREAAQATHAAFSSQLQENIASLRTAQELQQAQMNQGLSELKSLLLAQASGSRPSKRPAVAEPGAARPEMDMNDES